MTHHTEYHQDDARYVATDKSGNSGLIVGLLALAAAAAALLYFNYASTPTPVESGAAIEQPANPPPAVESQGTAESPAVQSAPEATQPAPEAVQPPAVEPPATAPAPAPGN
jgi:hypothetical protein